MARGATRTTIQETHGYLPQVKVPEQSLTSVRDAHATARRLDGILADFAPTILNVQVLQKAREGGYLLAVDSKTLPKQEGWHLVVRKDSDHDTLTFVPIAEDHANALIREGRMYDVLYVNKSAIKAAEEERPVALIVVFDNRYRRYLLALDWPNYDARVALSSPREASEPQPAKVLRVERGEALEVTLPDGQKMLMDATEARVLKRQ